jgi:hypothetical protein
MINKNLIKREIHELKQQLVPNNNDIVAIIMSLYENTGPNSKYYDMPEYDKYTHSMNKNDFKRAESILKPLDKPTRNKIIELNEGNLLCVYATSGNPEAPPYEPIAKRLKQFQKDMMVWSNSF